MSKTKSFKRFVSGILQSLASMLLIVVVTLSPITTNIAHAATAPDSYAYTKSFGGVNYDSIRASITDSQDNVYVAGGFSDTVDFDTGVGVDSHVSNGDNDAFITKLSSTGNYIYTKTFGGVVGEYVDSVAVDSQDNVYLAGSFSSTVDFDPGVGIDSHTSSGGRDAFVTKFSSSGNYIYTKTFGALSSDNVFALAVDSQDNIFSAGYFGSTVDFDPGAGVDNHTASGDTDIFLSKFTSTGTYLYSKTFGGTNLDSVEEIRVDSQDNVYLAGSFSGTIDFDPGVGVDIYSSNGVNDAYLTKFSSSGNYIYTKTLGGVGNDYLDSIYVDSQDNIYLAGGFSSTVDFDPSAGTDNRTSNGGNDAYLTKFSSSGNYIYTKTFGGVGFDFVSGVTVDSSSDVFLVGSSNEVIDFDPGPDFDSQGSVGVDSLFVSKFSADGTHRYAKTIGADSASTFTYSLVLDSKDNIYMFGEFYETLDFNPGPGVDTHVDNGNGNAFLTKFFADNNIDGDDLLNTIEDGHPNSGDGNGDGTQDSKQANVSSLPNSIVGSGAYVTLEAAGGHCNTISSISQNPATNYDPDTNYSYPLGLTDFSLDCDTPGDSADITIFYDKTYDTSDWLVRKYTNGSYATLNNAIFGVATVGSTTVTTLSYSISDGSSLDADGKSNGTIVDPIGVASPVIGSGLLADTGPSHLHVQRFIALTAIVVTILVIRVKRLIHYRYSGSL